MAVNTNTIKKKHEYLFSSTPDMMVIDETHFGSHANNFGAVTGLGDKVVEDIKDIKKDDRDHQVLNKYVTVINAKRTLQCSGTPYYILASGEFGKEYDLDDVKNLIEELKNKEIITIKEAESINPYVILKFTKSNIWNELKEAKEYHKEEPFYINIPANQIYEETPELQENILVQGIIDLYYIDKNGKIILVDYKTDYVEDEKELIEKYSEQLNLYKDAIQKALNKKVDKTIIYSTYLQKEIEL